MCNTISKRRLSNPWITNWKFISKKEVFQYLVNTHLLNLVNPDGSLSHFWSMFPIHTAKKHHKTFVLLVFSRGAKWEHLPEMG